MLQPDGDPPSRKLEEANRTLWVKGRPPGLTKSRCPGLLSEAGYTTVLSGKWPVGEAEGMRPHDIGFDEFYGYYPAQKELSQAFDKRRYPDLVLNPARLEMLRATGASEALIHGFKGGKTEIVEQVKSIEAVVLLPMEIRRAFSDHRPIYNPDVYC